MGLREGRLLLGEGLLCLPSPPPHPHIPDPVAARKSLGGLWTESPHSH